MEGRVKSAMKRLGLSGFNKPKRTPEAAKSHVVYAKEGDKKKSKANTLPYEERAPYEGEDKFFKSRPDVAGMAAEDDKIVMNPYSNLNKQQQDAVRRNEAYRIYMRQNKIIPDFDVSEGQAKFFKNTEYAGNPEAMKQTIAARILTGDRSITPTDKQIQWAKSLQKKAGF